jgi:hypothetical protein
MHNFENVTPLHGPSTVLSRLTHTKMTLVHESVSDVVLRTYGDHLKENEMGRICSMHKGNGKYVQNFSGKVRREKQRRDLGIDGE